MKTDPVQGKTIQWRFEGPLADKIFEHTFAEDGTVTYRTVDGHSGPSHSVKYQAATMSPSICAVSYLGNTGYTLTVILDFHTNRLAAFASNEKELSQHHGAFVVTSEGHDVPIQPRLTVRESRAQH